MKYQKDSSIFVPNGLFLREKPSEMQSIYIQICAHANDHGICSLSRKTLAKNAGVGIKSFDKYVLDLVAIGILEKIERIDENGGHVSNNYKLLFKEGVVLEKTLPQEIKSPEKKEVEKQIGEIIKDMTEVNPACSTYYNRQPQRNACRELIERYGFPQLKKVIAILPQTNKLPYVPTITTPLQLRDKWAQLESALTKLKAKKVSTLLKVGSL